MKDRTEIAENVYLAISGTALALAINLASLGCHKLSAFLAVFVPVFTFAAAKCGRD